MANPNIKDHAHKGGRPKGSKDKLSRDVKTRIMQVWDNLAANGQDLLDEAVKDPKWFYSNFVKGMVPKDVTVSGDDQRPLITEIVLRRADP